jgi:uncharacterized secreted protein with C-terminal beta-propeller domain
LNTLRVFFKGFLIEKLARERTCNVGKKNSERVPEKIGMTKMFSKLYDNTHHRFSYFLNQNITFLGYFRSSSVIFFFEISLRSLKTRNGVGIAGAES